MIKCNCSLTAVAQTVPLVALAIDRGAMRYLYVARGAYVHDIIAKFQIYFDVSFTRHTPPPPRAPFRRVGAQLAAASDNV